MGWGVGKDGVEEDEFAVVLVGRKFDKHKPARCHLRVPVDNRKSSVRYHATQHLGSMHQLDQS